MFALSETTNSTFTMDEKKSVYNAIKYNYSYTGCARDEDGCRAAAGTVEADNVVAVCLSERERERGGRERAANELEDTAPCISIRRLNNHDGLALLDRMPFDNNCQDGLRLATRPVPTEIKLDNMRNALYIFSTYHFGPEKKAEVKTNYILK